MMVLVKKLDDNTVEIELPLKSRGQDILDEVCRQLGIIETDYFGLQFQTRKGETLWLNLRNPVQEQVPLGGVMQPILHLTLRVKFHVSPHNIQQESTRYLFYQDAKLSARENKIRATPKDAARLEALALQGDFGDHNSQSLQLCYNPLFTAYSDHKDYKTELIANYERLRGMTKTSAAYRFLQEIGDQEDYGTDIFEARNESQDKVQLRVGTQAISIKNPESNEAMRIILENVIEGSVDGKVCHIGYLDEENNEVTTRSIEVRFNSKEQAEALYRAITEKHEFFVSDHVRPVVLSQNVRDFKGSIVSLFHTNSDVGKKYSFDVRRTCREVQEDTRRKLYKSHMANGASNIGVFPTELDRKEEMEVGSKEDILERLQSIKDAMLCPICRDANLNTALLPCGHLFCNSCAERISQCANCRQTVTQRHAIYMPNIEDIGCHS